MTSNYQQENEESKNRTIAFILTTLFNVALFLLCWYATVWTSSENIKREIIGGGGVLVNFGTDNQGSGDIYNKNHASDSKNMVESAPPKKEEIKKTVKVKPVTPPEPKVIRKPKPVSEQPVITSNRPSPVKVKEPIPTKVVTKTPSTSKPVTPRQPAEATPQPIPGATYPPRRTGGNGTSGTSTAQGAGGEGTGGGRGNQGQQDGNVVRGGTYQPRKPGTGGGDTGGDGTGKGSLAMAGWTWVSKPVIDINTDDEGIVRLRFKVDSDGDVQYIEVLEATVGNPAVVAKCKAKLKATKFRPTDDNDKAPLSTGTVTFKISSN